MFKFDIIKINKFLGIKDKLLIYKEFIKNLNHMSTMIIHYYM